ncbi:thiamine pyrophosphate-binding protein [Actinomadura sp. NPDC048032]|uniref:thiamine pyrophosphate-binding protein n=1 Tax=Actinomadura sp. NPDC048032 TaxID=3155747 RepID=UPI0033D9FDF7
MSSETRPAEPAAPPPAPTRHGGHLVAEILERNGVTHVFGQDSPEWLFEALGDSPVTATVMRDERSAGFAADAVARATGRPTVATGIHGPGAMNLPIALLEAKAAQSPVIALVSGVETHLHGTGAFQETDQVGIVTPLVKFAARAARPEDVEPTLQQAIDVAMTAPRGPVLVELPNDVMKADAHRAQPVDEPAVAASPVAAASTLDQAVTLIEAAARPVLLVGNGARQAGVGAGVTELAERLGAPVCTTAMGRGCFPERHPLYAGVAGFMSYREDGSGWVANEALRSADVVVVLGSAMDGATTDLGRLPGPACRVVRVDVEDVGSRFAAQDVTLVRDLVEKTLPQFLERLATTPRDPWMDLPARWDQVRARQQAVAADPVDVGLHPARLFRELGALLRPEDLVVCDAAYSSVWALSYLAQGEHFDQIVYGRAAGTLGFGFPGAIGLARAHPGRRVVALVGDGGFGFGWGELETARRHDCDVTCIVLNNGAFAYQRLWHDLNEGTSRDLDFVDVRHDLLAEAVGVSGHRVEAAEDLRPALVAALSTDGPTLVDVVVPVDTLPPFDMMRHVGV